MKSVKSRFVCFLLAFLLLLTGVMEAVVPVKAAYENTYKNTGDQRADLIGVALTQVGYREGSNNYTKYGVWYGASNTAWCGMFVSWCANQAGIPTSVIKKNGFANAAAFGLTDIYYAKNRTPRPGDLIFKSNNSHVGIVYYVEGSYVYCIEGNTSNTSDNGHSVLIRKRALSGSYYFAAPKYRSDSSSNHNYVKGNETAHPHKEFYKCSDCGSWYYTGKNGTVSDCKDCIMENCSHKYDSFSQLNETYHNAVCSKCTKQTKQKHTWGNDEIIKEPTCDTKGTKKQTCTQCGATRQTSIAATNQHTYGEWMYVDNDIHARICEVCNRHLEEKHTLSTWMYDGKEHWFTCLTCDGRAGMGQHVLEKGCESDCTVCGYNGEGHLFEEVWSQTEEQHWHNCLFCEVKQDVQNHTYSADCDETCDVCGYVRQTVHTFAGTIESDGTGHYYRCMVCGQAGSVDPHQPGAPATEQQAQKCTVCDFELAPKLEHVHQYPAYQSDATTHWSQCVCGEVLEPQGHLWDFSTGKCQICDAPVPVVEKPTIPWMIVLPATAGGSVLLVLLIGIVTIRKRRAKKARLALQKELEGEPVPV